MTEAERKASSAIEVAETSAVDGKMEIGRPAVLLVCGSLVYYHCAYRGSSLLSLVSDVLLVFLCSLAILGMLFRQMNITVPVDPLEWQISQDTANTVIACLANTVGAAESVSRVAATGHDKRLFLKVVLAQYLLAALGRIATGATIAYGGLCILCLSFPRVLSLDLSSLLNYQREETLHLEFKISMQQAMTGFCVYLLLPLVACSVMF